MNPILFFIKRILLLPLVVLAAHFVSFSYAQLAIKVQLAQNPWGSSGGSSLDFFSLYYSYIQKAVNLDFGFMPGGTVPIHTAIFQASLNSLGLFLIAFFISAFFGLIIGLRSVKTEPPSIARWLTPLTTLGLATPGFFIATLFIVATIYYIMAFGQSTQAPLPLSGFGWDEHLILPLIALTIRPTAQIAQVTAALLTGEFSKQYIVAARAFGNTWKTIRRKHALRNVLAPILVNISGSLRYLLAELILVEWIFNWPGLGRLLALTLIPPSTSNVSGFGVHVIYFLYPDLLAAILAVFALIFFLVDSFFSGFILWIDPRIRALESQALNE